jgi:endo-1,4-beta-xylanase
VKFFINVLAVLLLILVSAAASAGAIRDDAVPATVPAAGADTGILKEQYRDFFLLGYVVSPRDLGGPRFELLQKHFAILTAENAMKPLYLQREEGVFSFETADALVDAALEAGLQMHGHTLVWHQQSPEWINREGIDRDAAIENLIAHAKTVTGHFKGRVISWDVLNEAIVDNPADPNDWRASLRQTPWYRAIGPDYIEIAFRVARKADPAAKLYYNDYNLDNPRKAQAVYRMIQEVNALHPKVLGRPLIDGVGMQGHYGVNTNIERVNASMERFIALGVEVSITELDVQQAGFNAVMSEEQALQQGMAYARLFALFKEHSASLGRVTIWGLDDGTSWRSPTNPTLFDKDLQPKPAFWGAYNPAGFIAENEGKLAALKKDPLRADARYGAPALDPEDPLWETAPAIPVNQQIMAWQGAWGSARVLWDEQNLYVRLTVMNAELNKSHPSAHEQDSIEVFIDSGQYRVNFDNEQTFNPPGIAAGFESAVVVGERSYTVTAKIPFRTEPRADAIVGFDMQINGASTRGMRQSIAVWNDSTGNAWQDSSLYGQLRLVK